MQRKSKELDRIEVNPYDVSHPSVRSDLWRNTMGYDSILPAMVRGSASDSSSLEQSMDQSQSDSKMNEEDDDTAKQSQSVVNQHPGIISVHFKIFFPLKTSSAAE